MCATAAGACSLRAAIQESNAIPGADIVLLPAGTYPITVGSTGEDEAEQGDLDILDDVTITGAGADVTRLTGSGGLFRIIAVLSSDSDNPTSVLIENVAFSQGLDSARGGAIFSEGSLSLRNVLVEDGGFENSAVFSDEGSLTVENSTFDGNATGIETFQGSVFISDSLFVNHENTTGHALRTQGTVGVIENSEFSNNTATRGAPAFESVGSNLAITGNNFVDNTGTEFADSSAVRFDTGTYTLRDNVFTNNINTANIGPQAGAMHLNGATVFIEDNVFTGNVASVSGGAIFLTNGSYTITDSVFESNSAENDCGAISSGFTTLPANSLTIINSLFTGNSAGDSGGAVCMDNNTSISNSSFSANSAMDSGGAILATDDNTSITNSTISNNSAVFGSAVFQIAGANSRLDLRHVTINDNASVAGDSASVVSTRGRITLTGSVVAGTGTDFACEGDVSSLGFNIASDDSCELSGQGDMIGNPMLGALTSSGGLPAHVPQVRSPAIGSVPSDLCPLIDQDFQGRTGTACDIGAIQSDGPDVNIGVIQFGSSDFQVSELGETAELVISRVGGSFGEASVQLFETRLGEANSITDYSSVNRQSIFWADGDTEDKFVEVSIRNDFIEEGNETVTFALAGATGGAALGLVDNATLTIIDDETSASVISFSDQLIAVNESDELVTVTIERIADSVGVASVLVSTVEGSALAGQDYTETSQTVQFAGGETSLDVVIRITDDNELEGDETFTVTLSDPTNGATLASPSTLSVIIIGNDNAADSTDNSSPGTGGPTTTIDDDDATGNDTTGGAADDDPGADDVTSIMPSSGGGGAFSALFGLALLSLIGYRRRRVSQ